MQQKTQTDFTVLIIAFIVIIAALCSCQNYEGGAIGEADGRQIKEKLMLPICPKCLEIGCIYEDIDGMSDGTDTGYYNAIMYVAKERKLTQKQVELLLTEYYL